MAPPPPQRVEYRGVQNILFLVGLRTRGRPETPPFNILLLCGPPLLSY